MTDDFIGTGTRLKASDYSDAAKLLEVDVASVGAVVEVEAASFGFDAKKRPRILFEPHIFYRELGSGDKRQRAVGAGLAYRSWGEKPYPRTMDARYEQLRRAMDIDAAAALASASWGLGQVMGFNYELAGFGTVHEFVQAMMQGEREQLLAMAGFIKANGLDAHMRSKDWRAFARGYNGPGYERNRYHTKLANAYARYSAGGSAEEGVDPVLRKGSRGAAVEEAQRLLNRYGYGLVVDGHYGAQTELAVHAFQTEHDLLVDGVIGKATWAVLRTRPDEADPEPEDAIPAPPGVDHPRPPQKAGDRRALWIALSGIIVAAATFFGLRFAGWSLRKRLIAVGVVAALAVGAILILT